MESKTPIGFWTTEAPVTPEQIDEDMAVLMAIVIPEGCHLNSAEVYVTGRLWYWERLAIDFGSVRREPEDV